MKVLPFKIPKPENNALVYQIDKGKVLYNHLHDHEEIQISIILNGEGDLVVGDTINHFKTDDIFVIGSNIPHLFRSVEQADEDAHMLTLFFTKESFGKLFFDLLELQELESFFRMIKGGLKLETNKKEVMELFLQLERQTHLERFIGFLNILKLISKSETSSLSSFIYSKVYSDDEGERMSNVMNHAISNFNKDITLDEVANIASMTPNAFCRYFKQRTNKTFFQFLLEVRLEHACRLLLKSKDLNVSQISYASGFKNISNFNRKFKEFKGITPTFYRNIEQTQKFA